MCQELKSLKVGIFGFGGHAKEVSHYLIQNAKRDMRFFVDAQFLQNDHRLKPITEFDPAEYSITIALGDSKKREFVANRMPNNTVFRTIISVQSHCPPDFEQARLVLGVGTMVAAGATLTCQLTIGKHALLNTGCSIHHDVMIGDFFTASPGSRVLGNCRMGHHVHIGTNAVCLEGISVCDHVIIGAGAVVTEDIHEPGIFVGIPARKIKEID